MKVIVGLIIISIGFYLSLSHLDQTILQFWDFIAFVMVCLGTFSVSIMTMPSFKLKHFFSVLKAGLRSNAHFREKCIQNALGMIKGESIQINEERIDQKILGDGLEMIKLGFSPEKIEMILTERINKYSEDALTIAHWVRGLSKYPPAFGLAGTVIGLIHLMNGLGETSDARETGLRMAIALIATFYGIVVANLFVNPVGDRIVNNIKEDQNLSEISLKTILLKAEDTNYLEALEFMNSYIPTQYKKIKFESIATEERIAS